MIAQWSSALNPTVSYVHKKLRASNEWNYHVYAFNRFGNSKTTSGGDTLSTAAPKRPTPPSSLLILQVDGGTATTSIAQLYWTAPDDGGQDVEKYRVEVSNKKDHWPSEAFTAVGHIGRGPWSEG